ncbi:hypothetical protein FIBSPDRAFT_901277 [Athelia psychrophila]|uniref:Uncharacterized protein n=1 Tax=Athelia psychrophila TaxID=1759441 RepID=A0A167WUJ7_9AGAM|nr:hypothetical protein FIBSPDRAFT_902768 [Fibularhizoctonia sp. CBS 109695]KZP08374.1 hypothetical protein FIBSPDRAFT_901277 [Fibularhizoctonia sp. CBS 109695]
MKFALFTILPVALLAGLATAQAPSIPAFGPLRRTHNFTEYMNIQCHARVGGTDARKDKAKLQEGVQVVIGTPIYEVLHILPQGTKVVLHSVNMPTEVLEVTKKYMRDPVWILVKPDELNMEGIKQFYIAVDKEEWKLDTLCDLFETVTKQAVIFCNTRRGVDWLTEKMKSHQFIVSVMTKSLLEGTSKAPRHYFVSSHMPSPLVLRLACATTAGGTIFAANVEICSGEVSFHESISEGRPFSHIDRIPSAGITVMANHQ